MSYVLLHGAKKNVGDFLIFDRAKKLLRDHLKNGDFIELPRWQSVEAHLDTINSSRALIICGGPGYSTNFHPGVYPLIEDLSRIKVPIIPFGLGWIGRPAGHPEKFKFTDRSLSAIRSLHTKIHHSSVRDPLTLDILKRLGIENVLMTGCPTWYLREKLERPFDRPRTIRCVAVSMAQNRIYHRQNVTLLNSIKSMIDRHSSGVRFIAVFHRGLSQDEFTSEREAAALQKLAQATREAGYEIYDAAYDLSRMDIYQEADLHIGYRVHAHIFTLSHRKPSFLLWEDGRGMGVSSALGLKRDLPAMNLGFLRFSGLEATSFNATRGITGFVLKRLILNKAAPERMAQNVYDEIAHGFPSFEGLHEVLKKHFATMKQFLDSIPR